MQNKSLLPSIERYWQEFRLNKVSMRDMDEDTMDASAINKEKPGAALVTNACTFYDVYENLYGWFDESCCIRENSYDEDYAGANSIAYDQGVQYSFFCRISAL